MVFLFLPSFWLVAGILFLNGCTPAGQTLTQDEKYLINSQTDSESIPIASNPPKTSDIERLAQLWQGRSKMGLIADYPIGPGDVLEISVPAMQELSNLTVRVSGKGRVSLPFLGVVQDSCLTEK